MGGPPVADRIGDVMHECADGVGDVVCECADGVGEECQLVVGDGVGPERIGEGEGGCCWRSRRGCWPIARRRAGLTGQETRRWW